MHLSTIMSSFDSFPYAFGICMTFFVVCITASLDPWKRIERALALHLRLDEKRNKQEDEVKLQRTDAATSKKYPIRWWKDSKLFELERRAIFSKEWYYVTHSSRFKKIGDYRTFEIAGFSFIVILGKDKQLRAFHNVCRHRAYAVTKKEVGSSAVLGCRYHGWSYDTKGKLIKAPEFDSVEGFEKGSNGLWEVKVKILEAMVFINFDNTNEISKLDLGEIKTRLRRWGMSKMNPVSDWKIEGAFNWKLMNSLETSPGSQSTWQELLSPWTWNQKNDMKILRNTFVFRYNSRMILFLKVVPKSAILTSLDCCLFATDSNISETVVQELKKSVSLQVNNMISSQRRLLRDQSFLSESTIANQEEINQILKDHVNAEEKGGAEIHPAARLQNFTLEGKADDDFCRELEDGRSSVCNANSKRLLDW